MSEMKIIEPMLETEARLCLLAIKANLHDARRSALEFAERQGWRALSYPSLAACLEVELGYSYQHGYRLLQAAEVERNIETFSPIGENPPPLKEAHVRGTGITALPPEQQAEAYRQAQELAAAEGGGQITTRHVQDAVALVKTKRTVFQSRYYVVSHAVATGLITAETGAQMVEALGKLKPKLRGDIVQLMGKFNLTCAELIAPIAEMVSRQGTERESKVLPEILLGFLGGTPLNKATMTDLTNAQQEAAKLHAAEAAEARRQEALARGEFIPQEVNLTLFIGDVFKSKKALRKALGDNQYSRLLDAMLAD